MRQAKVIVSDLSGRSNKIFKSGDTVNESNFHPGSFDKLINGGYIVEKFTSVVEEETFIPPVFDKFIKKILTKKDFKNNPDLYQEGFKIGDEIEIPNPDYKEESE